MPRTFNGTSDYMAMAGGGTVLGMTYGTMAAVIKPNGLQWQSIWEACNATPLSTSAAYDTISVELEDVANTSTFVRDASGTAIAISPSVADGWCFFAHTKATGSVAPHAYKFVYSTGVATTADGSSTADATRSVAIIQIGRWEFDADWMKSDVAAIGVWKNRALTDSELLRLTRGRWTDFNPDFHVEFPGGADNPTRALRDISRGQVRQTAISGTTRTGNFGPPGFRYSARERRM